MMIMILITWILWSRQGDKGGECHDGNCNHDNFCLCDWKQAAYNHNICIHDGHKNSFYCRSNDNFICCSHLHALKGLGLEGNWCWSLWACNSLDGSTYDVCRTSTKHISFTGIMASKFSWWEYLFWWSLSKEIFLLATAHFLSTSSFSWFASLHSHFSATSCKHVCKQTDPLHEFGSLFLMCKHIMMLTRKIIEKRRASPCL